MLNIVRLSWMNPLSGFSGNGGSQPRLRSRPEADADAGFRRNAWDRVRDGHSGRRVLLVADDPARIAAVARASPQSQFVAVHPAGMLTLPAVAPNVRLLPLPAWTNATWKQLYLGGDLEGGCPPLPDLPLGGVPVASFDHAELLLPCLLPPDEAARAAEADAHWLSDTGETHSEFAAQLHLYLVAAQLLLAGAVKHAPRLTLGHSLLHVRRCPRPGGAMLPFSNLLHCRDRIRPVEPAPGGLEDLYAVFLPSLSSRLGVQLGSCYARRFGYRGADAEDAEARVPLPRPLPIQFPVADNLAAAEVRSTTRRRLLSYDGPGAVPDSAVSDEQLRARARQLLRPACGEQHVPSPHPSGRMLLGSRPRAQRRDAYATVLHSGDSYVCGAVVLARSIRDSGSQKDLVALINNQISISARKALLAAGWDLIMIEKIRSHNATKGAYNEFNYTKLRIWQLFYDKVVFIDADLLVLHNLDHLFEWPELTARWNHYTLFNSGLMVFEPSQCTFEDMMAKRTVIPSYNGGDQGFLNHYFPFWHRLPDMYAVFKEAAYDTKRSRLWNVMDTQLDEIMTVHYFGKKPWRCYRDFDCNCGLEWSQQFCFSVPHGLWWMIHDRMPQDLQTVCGLSEKDKIRLARHPITQSIEVTDPRQHQIALLQAVG